MSAARPRTAPSARLWTLDATELASLVRARKVSATEAIESAIARIEATRAALNAVVLPCFDEARARAQALDAQLDAGAPGGPLSGVPITVKDQMRVAGLPTTMGLPSRRQRIDRDEGPLVSRLRAAGAIVVGKTSTPQLLFGFETESKMWGRTNNPWNKDRAPAASSGGEAANLAAGGAALGLGGDLGGSVRAPAAVTGLFGLRPSVGRLSLLDGPEGVFKTPLLGLSAVHGPLARSARDIGLAMEVLAPYDPSDPTCVPVPLGDWRALQPRALRIGYFEDDGLVAPAPAVRRAVREAAAALASAGAHVEAIGAFPAERALGLAFAFLCADGGAVIRDALGDDVPDPALANTLRGMGAPKALISLLVWMMKLKGERRMAALFSRAGKKTAREVALLLAERDALRAEALEAMDALELDAVLCPPCALVAAKHGFPEQGILTAAPTFLFSLLDFPSGVAPVTRVREGEESDRALLEPADRVFAEHERGSAGLPAGVQIAARPFREDVVVAVMAAMEGQLRGGAEYPLTPVDPRG
jgi:fatty acid amide hydrolase